jgi:predicted DNA-binding transcriptional regulator YafY
MERLLRILITLADRQPDGLSARRLGQVAGYSVDTESGLSALRRDLRALRRHGWAIVSDGGDGAEGYYRLQARDNRMALLLTAGEQAALLDALSDSAGDVPAPPAQLAGLERAVEQRCLTRFSYRHKLRTVHPHTLHNGPSGWMLRGREVESGMVKEYVVRRIVGDVAIDRPGSAAVPEPVPRRSFDPMTWDVDPPVDVTLATTADYEPEVLRVMTGSRVAERGRETGVGDEVRIVVPVTHRVAFRSRLFELGLRVRVVDPPAARELVLAVLGEIASAEISSKQIAGAG